MSLCASRAFLMATRPHRPSRLQRKITPFSICTGIPSQTGTAQCRLSRARRPHCCRDRRPGPRSPTPDLRNPSAERQVSYALCALASIESLPRTQVPKDRSARQTRLLASRRRPRLVRGTHGIMSALWAGLNGHTPSIFSLGGLGGFCFCACGAAPPVRIHKREEHRRESGASPAQ